MLPNRDIWLGRVLDEELLLVTGWIIPTLGKFRHEN